MTQNETQKIFENQSNTPSVLSGAQAKIGNGSASGFLDEVVRGVRNMSSEWIILLLFAVFVAVVGVELTLKKQGMNSYKEDVISGTHKEFPITHNDNVLLNEVVSSSNIFLRASDVNKNIRKPDDATYQKLTEIARGRKR
jgi:hypothetical protein